MIELAPRRAARVARDGAILARRALHGGRALRLAGSDDPLLDLIATGADRVGAPGSFGGLTALWQQRADAATLHLRHRDGGYNAPFAARILDGRRPILVHLWRREQGIILPRGNPDGIATVADLLGRTVALRASGTGTRVLLERLLRDAGADPAALRGPASRPIWRRRSPSRRASPTPPSACARRRTRSSSTSSRSRGSRSSSPFPRPRSEPPPTCSRRLSPRRRCRASTSPTAAACGDPEAAAVSLDTGAIARPTPTCTRGREAEPSGIGSTMRPTGVVRALDRRIWLSRRQRLMREVLSAPHCAPLGPGQRRAVWGSSSGTTVARFRQPTTAAPSARSSSAAPVHPLVTAHGRAVCPKPPRFGRRLRAADSIVGPVSAPGSRSLELVLPAVPASVSHARCAVASLLDRLDVDLWVVQIVV